MPSYVLGAIAGVVAVFVYRLTQKNKNDKDKKD